MNLFELIDSIRMIGKNGLKYADNPYDEARYERLLELASACYSEALEIPAGEVRESFAEEIGHVTPKIGAGSAVFNDEGEVLLVKRSDDRKWCRPCGFVEPGESPEETAVRETREETGLEVEPRRLVGVYTREAGEYGPHSFVALVYLCRVEGGELETSHETEEVGFKRVDEIPEENWHKDHRMTVLDAREAMRESRNRRELF